MFRHCIRLMRLATASADDLTAAFKVLGISCNVAHIEASSAGQASMPSIDDVRRHYRELARLHHPDLGGGDDSRMKVINTAYDLIQSSGVLLAPPAGATAAAAAGVGDGASAHAEKQGATASRFVRKAGTRRRRLPDDFANGDDSSWAMKSTLEWRHLVNSTATLTEAELTNPANHPFSYSKYFSFEDDVNIYRMIRGGATVAQVGRTLGKPATFVERRLHNAQFRNRIQYVLRAERRQDKAPSAVTASTAKGKKTSRSASASAPDMTRRLLRRSPFETSAAWDGGVRMTRKKEWQATPSTSPPVYFDDMTLEEKGRYAKLLRTESGGEDKAPDWLSASRPTRSKLGRSYANYARLHVTPPATSSYPI